jgi:tungstate transport system substrate-binding protein
VPIPEPHFACHSRIAGATVIRRVASAVIAIAAFALLPVAVAAADDASTVTVVGTSDVQDSGLMPNLIKPAFQAAYPQYTLNYVSKGTGAAIQFAEAGTASGLLVHAASLENQFVAAGYSAETYGRAIFYGDYVLLGPASDPAGVLTGAPHDIAAALTAIATAGKAGKADFVSRGGTPGTTVEEHQIWALTSAPAAAGLTLCLVSAANGGGSAPSTAGGVCPSSQTPPTADAPPSWYHVTGLTQGPNILAADTCNFTNAASNGGNDCYVLTDRGTFNFLQSQGSLAHMGIVTRNNTPAAAGGQDLLVNSFHAYAISPTKFAGTPNVAINLPGAQAFLNFLTSPGFQSQLKSYLGGSNDPPFLADASPSLTAGTIPAVVAAGSAVTLTGSLRNAVPGTPALAGQTVTVSETIAGLPAGVPVGSATTDAAGNYSVTFAPTSSGSYQVTSGAITQIENPSLNPIFADLLQPAATAATPLSVQGGVTILSATPGPGQVVVTGSVAPGSGHANASAAILARPQGSTAAFTQIASTPLGAGVGTFSITAPLAAGKWQVEASFQDPGRVLAATSSALSITVPAKPGAATPASAVSIKTLSVKRGKVTLGGSISPAATGSASYVRLLAQRGARLGGASKAAAFSSVSKISLGSGRKTFTFHVTLRRHYRWALQLEYVHGHKLVTYSHSRSVDVR